MLVDGIALLSTVGWIFFGRKPSFVVNIAKEFSILCEGKIKSFLPVTSILPAWFHISQRLKPFLTVVLLGTHCSHPCLTVVFLFLLLFLGEHFPANEYIDSLVAERYHSGKLHILEIFKNSGKQMAQIFFETRNSAEQQSVQMFESKVKWLEYFLKLEILNSKQFKCLSLKSNG